MQESWQSDDRMQDTYSQLRRSAYSLSNNATLVDDTDGEEGQKQEQNTEHGAPERRKKGAGLGRGDR